MAKFFYDPAPVDGFRLEVDPDEQLAPDAVIAISQIHIVEELRRLNVMLKRIGFDADGYNAAQKLDELVDEFKVARRKL